MEHQNNGNPTSALCRNRAPKTALGGANAKTKQVSLNSIKYKAKSPKKQPARSSYSLGKTGRSSKEHSSGLTAQKVRQLLGYEAEKPKMTWLADRGRFRCKGKEAGTLCGGYVRIEIDGRFYNRSRLIWLYMTGEWPPTGYFVDHIDRDKTNDRWENLRLATPSENSRNRTPCARNKSGFVGVCWNKPSNKWCAFINIANKCVKLGLFTEFDAACDARIAAEIEHYGEFSRRVA